MDSGRGRAAGAWSRVLASKAGLTRATGRNQTPRCWVRALAAGARAVQADDGPGAEHAHAAVERLRADERGAVRCWRRATATAHVDRAGSRRSVRPCRDSIESSPGIATDCRRVVLNECFSHRVDAIIFVADAADDSEETQGLFRQLMNAPWARHCAAVAALTKVGVGRLTPSLFLCELFLPPSRCVSPARFGVASGASTRA
eukprot:4594851-Prymnesium_polylepis.4